MKISTCKLQDRLWKLLIRNNLFTNWMDTADIWDLAGDMIDDPKHNKWERVSKENIIYLICNL